MLDHIFRTNIFAYYQGNRYQQLAVYFDLFSLSMTTLVMDSHLRNCTYIYEHKKIRKNGNIFKVNYLHTLTGGTEIQGIYLDTVHKLNMESHKSGVGTKIPDMYIH